MIIDVKNLTRNIWKKEVVYILKVKCALIDDINPMTLV